MKVDVAGLSQSVQSLTARPNGLGNQTAAQGAPAQSAAAAQPAAVYHAGEAPGGDSLLNKTGVRLYAQMLYTQQEWDEAMKIPPGIMPDIGKPSSALRYAYDAALSQLSPELRAKDWGFSISDGKLVLTGADALSDGESAAILAALRAAGVEETAKGLADFVVNALEEDRYWSYRYLGKGIGGYDVSATNFGDIVDLRTYMEDFREGGRYDPHLVDPTDYVHGYYAGGLAIMEQVAANANRIEVPRRQVFV